MTVIGQQGWKPSFHREGLRGTRENNRNNSREREAQTKKETAEIQDLGRTRNKILDELRARGRDSSRERVAQINREKQADTNRSREALKAKDEEIAADREKGRNADRTIRRESLEERKLAREQRERFAALRAEQGRVGRGFLSWQTILSHIGSIIAFEIVFQVANLGRRLIEVTQNFERLRLGIAAYEG